MVCAFVFNLVTIVIPFNFIPYFKLVYISIHFLSECRDFSGICESNFIPNYGCDDFYVGTMCRRSCHLCGGKT